MAKSGTYKDSSGRGTYSVKHTYSQHDSVGDFWAHSDSPGGDPLQHNPNGTIHLVHAPLDQRGDLAELQVDFTVKFPLIVGRKMAHLLWAFGTEENGEIDIPEAKLDGGIDKGNLFIRAWVDGQQIYAGDAANIPNPMHWVGQFETYLTGQPIPTTNIGQGHTLYDKYRMCGR